MLHPLIVHFAIVLPLVALVLSLIYLYKRDETMSKLSSYYLVQQSQPLLKARMVER